MSFVCTSLLCTPPPSFVDTTQTEGIVFVTEELPAHIFSDKWRKYKQMGARYKIATQAQKIKTYFFSEKSAQQRGLFLLICIIESRSSVCVGIVWPIDIKSHQILWLCGIKVIVIVIVIVIMRCQCYWRNLHLFKSLGETIIHKFIGQSLKKGYPAEI